MKQRILNTLNNFSDIIIFCLFVTIKLLICGKEIETGYFTYKGLVLPILSSVVLLCSLAILFKKTTRTKILFFLDIIITIFIIADLNYFRYFKDLISIPVILNGFQLGAVKSSVANLFKFTDLFYALNLVLYIPILTITKYKKESTCTKPFKRNLSLCVGLFTIFGIINGIQFFKLAKEQPRLLTTMYNKVYIAKNLGDLNYHCLDVFNSLVNTISRKAPVSSKTKSKVQTFLQDNANENHTSSLTGVGKGKNLIVIQVEALQEFPINKKINGKEITPNLNRWINRSAYFNNYFYQTASGGTSDAEFLSNNSLYPASSGAVTQLYSGNEFNALPKTLKKNGYYTAGFHGFRETFWNRNIMYPKYGFEKFFGEKSFNIDENIGLGLSDKSFLKQCLEKIKNLPKPYYSFLVTLTSHYPYDDVTKYGDFNVGKFEGTFLGNYLKSIHYTDAQLGVFLDNLGKENILNDSIIALYGDHYAIPREHEKELANFLGKESFTELQWMKLQKVPMFIHFPNDAYNGTRHTYGGQIDLYPTLTNILDIKQENMLGKDLFNAKQDKVIFRNGSFSNGHVFYLSQQNKYYDIKTEKEVPENDELKNLKESVVNELQYSDLILKHNLLKKFNSAK